MRIANFKKLKHFFFSEKTEEMKSYYKDNLAYSRKFKSVDGPFGLNPCNPILLQGNHRIEAYLRCLHSYDSIVIFWEFVDHVDAPNLNVQVEEYRIIDDCQEEIAVLYFCTGAVFDSEQVPEGFYMEHPLGQAA